MQLCAYFCDSTSGIVASLLSYMIRMASSAFQRPTFALTIGGNRIEYDMNMYDDEVEKVACVDEIDSQCHK